MVFQYNSYPIYLSTDNATIKDTARGRFEFVLEDTLNITSEECYVGLSKIGFVNNFLNISVAIGNNKFYYSDDGANETKYTITIPDGSWGLTELNSFIASQLLATHSSILFELTGISAVNKVQYKFNAAGWYIHFDTDSPFAVLGGTSLQEIPASKSSTINYVETATNVAGFGVVSALKIISSVLGGTAISNTTHRNIVHESVVTTLPGSVQSDEPNNIHWVKNHMNGVSRIDLQFVNQDDSPIAISDNINLVFIIRSDDRQTTDF